MTQIKLQKYFTDCGVLSRRAAEAEIEAGRVSVNGQPATLGMRIDPESDTVEYRGKLVLPTAEARICILLNKPRGIVTTMHDEKGRPTVASLVTDLGTRVYPIGRLDMDSDGLLLLTNDGALAEHLMHPRHEIPKIYRVTVRGAVDAPTLTALGRPMVLDGYRIRPVKTRICAHDSEHNRTVLEMELYEGRNRQIRKMCAAVGLEITRLCRIAIGEIALGSTPSGKWRMLTDKEIQYLMGTADTLARSTEQNKKGLPHA